MTDKSNQIKEIVNYFREKYGKDNVLIKDYWDDYYAIGLTEKTGTYLAYISTISEKDNDFYLSLEDPSEDDNFPYSDAGIFDELSLSELEEILAKHLRLI